MAENAGEVNAYYCPTCRGYIVTRLADNGTTPFMLACHVQGEPNGMGNTCTGIMQSLFYPEQPWPEKDGNGDPIPSRDEPTHEWYRPDDEEMKRLNPLISEHVQNGGLLLRDLRA